ncbi:MAG: hypothetical protein WBG86_17330, partial [Polyangiales bacterium]
MSRVLLAFVMCVVAVGCASSAQKATTNWVELRTENLRLRTNLSEREALNLARESQQLGSVVIPLFPCAADHLSDVIDVTVIATDDGSRGSYGAPSTPLLDLPPRLVVRGRSTTVLLRLVVHELAHKLLATCVPNAPPWLNEGMASYFETSKIEDGKLRLGFPSYLFVDQVAEGRVTDVAWASYLGEPIVVFPKRRAPDFDQLRTMPRSKFYADGLRQTVHYAGAWLAVHMLSLGDLPLQRRFARYLEMLRGGADPEYAWKVAFAGVDVAALYRERLAARQSPWVEQPVEVPPERPPSKRPMPPAEVAILRAELEDW